MNEEDELLEVVNTKGQILGVESRGKIYQKGLLHRAVNILVYNRQGKIYLQQRSRNKKAFPLFWDLSAAEHLKVGESYVEAAKRGLQEELGIKVVSLKEIRSSHQQKNAFFKGKEQIIENELVVLCKVVFNGQIKIDLSEVSKGGFFSVKEINKMVNSTDIKFTPWFLDEWMYLISSDNKEKNVLF